ncbi:hypothetical protein [Flammeovirga sp. SJP92]|uniref:hypothetical protein n=1 Tax=Flammeovirga sp. SJP92 TaxID=1775430 RepID=UPI0012F8CD3D|nr:hypothetical protein [Flammeovirga sp. SJP92]
MQHLYPIYVAGEFYIVVNLFLTELKAEKKWKILSGVISLCFLIEAGILWFLNNDASNGFGKILSHLTIICMAVFVLIKNLKELTKSNPLTVIHASLLLYYSVSLFLFMIMDQLNNINLPIWIINAVLASILYITFIYTFYRLNKWSLKSNS